MKIFIIIFFCVFTINCVANTIQNTKPEHASIYDTKKSLNKRPCPSISNITDSLYSPTPKTTFEHHKKEIVSQPKKIKAIVRNYPVAIF
ncbi:MAG: hypothetical protein QS721_03520 [Candidatus Endonucleobacter sp. (ex Gigantidas childressi)]|nr:hypothetical protein [Candidatus Endonucleobacter sp. (ex Gigantidas childressi)]